MVGADPVQIAATIAALRELEGLDALWLGHCSGDAFIAACDALGLGDGLYVGAAGQRLTISHGQYHLDDVTVAPRGVALPLSARYNGNVGRSPAEGLSGCWYLVEW